MTNDVTSTIVIFISYMKAIESENISLVLTNVFVFAKIICYFNFIENNFVSAEIIAALNKSVNNRLAYNQSVYMFLFIDISFFFPYNSDESDQISFLYALD